jgi:Tfp pilus assembly protein PilF
VAQLQLKRYPDSETNFKRALELDASLTTAVFNLAVAHMAQGKTEEAMSGFDMFAQRADQSKDAARIIAAQGFIMQMREEQEKE